MPVQPAAIELLRDLSRILDRWGRWYVFGAQAVIAYGVPRLSADVDVTLFIEPDEPEGLVVAMQGGGFDLLVHAEDLMIAKILAGRPKDIEDAKALWKARGAELNAARIRHVLHLLEDALSQSDLLPTFNSIAP